MNTTMNTAMNTTIATAFTKTDLVICKSENYDIFSSLEYNRAVSKGLVNKLIKSIKTRNHTAYNPIMVNKKFQIIDGQHRFAACKALGLPIFFIVCNDTDFQTITLLNANSKTWSTADYLHAYVEKGIHAYIGLSKFMAAHPKLLLVDCVAILSGAYSIDGKFLDKFKAGEFRVNVGLAKAEETAEVVAATRDLFKSSGWKIGAAGIKLYREHGYKLAMQKINVWLKYNSATVATNEREINRVIEDVLNYRNKGEKIKFGA